MKKLIIAAFICLFGVFASCKEKENTEADQFETTEITPDNTAVDTTTTTQIDDPEPGVESSGSQEQIP